MADKEIGFQLVRPNPDHIYRVLTCENCGNDSTFEIALADNGQWSIECLSCEESAVTLSDLLETLG